MNITDIDDKIIKNANEQGKPFSEFSRYWETEYFEDMRRLNVELPDVVTRVSEFVPEIVRFIEKIVSNGYAYEANGSVYFNVAKYNDGEKHKYAKLEPTSATDQEKLLEGEGVLTADLEASEKLNKFDFALWKKSKAGEPAWDSPWGQGRPGWHIECSCMAAEYFKEWPIDIHSGGIDLRFPHHDNEIAQSEAFYECDQWINYFLHTGHLHIMGKKMSKSLKNFITIKHILSEYNARQVRMLFLLHNWDSLMNYTTEKSMPQAVEKERQFSEFFKTVKATLRQCNIASTVQKWSARDYELNEVFTQTQTTVHARLADNFDTPEAVKSLSELVTAANVYLQQDRAEIKLPLVRQVSKYVLKILKVFGIYDDDIVPSAGRGTEATAASQEEAIAPLMDILARARDQIKERAAEGPAAMAQICNEHLELIKAAAKDTKGEDVQEMIKIATDFFTQVQAKSSEGPKSLFGLCDDLRDDVLPNLGVRLEDRAKGQAAIWKYEDREVLLKERQAKIADREKKEEEKRRRKEEETRKKSTPAQNWFREFRAAEFSQFDDAGLPSHDAKGKELSEAIRNKLKKDWNKQNEVYQKWLTEQ